MEIGCCVIAEDVERLSECGFDFVELPGKELSRMDPGHITALRRRLDKYKLSCKCLNAYCPKDIIIAGPGQNLGEVKAYARKLAAYASELSVRHVGIGAPRSRNLPEGYDKKLASRQLQEFLQYTADEFAVYDIYVSLEAVGACYCNYINHLEEAAYILETVKHPFLRMVVDFYNMEQSGEADIDLEPYIPFIAHVHISDDDGGADRRGFLKPEKYACHAKRLTGLRVAGYNGTVSLEVDCPPDPQLSIRSCDFLKRILVS